MSDVKYAKGDILLVKFIVSEAMAHRLNGGLYVAAGFYEKQISTHTKPPWVPCPSDRVRYKVAPSAITFRGEGVVLCVHDERAWVQFDEHSVPLSPLIDHIELVK